MQSASFLVFTISSSIMYTGVLNHIACKEEDGIDLREISWIKLSRHSMYFFLMKNQHFGLSGNLLIPKFELTKLMKVYWLTPVCWFGCWYSRLDFLSTRHVTLLPVKQKFYTHFTHQTQISVEFFFKKFMNFASTCKEVGGLAQIPFSLVLRYNFKFLFLKSKTSW